MRSPTLTSALLLTFANFARTANLGLFYPAPSLFLACGSKQTAAVRKTVLPTSDALSCAMYCGRQGCCRFKVEGNQCILFGLNKAPIVPNFSLQVFNSPKPNWPCTIHTSGSSYFLIEQRLTWDDSFHTCRLKFGRLAELDSKVKVDYFLQMIRQNSSEFVRECLLYERASGL